MSISLKYFCLSTLLTLGFVTMVSAQETINWISWDEAVSKSKINKKKIFVDIYTDWCHYCKKMDKNTFQQADIAKYINKHYYAVKFDAEQKETIIHNNKEYKYIKNGRRGYNELAAELTRGRLSYPTIVFMDEELNIIQPIPGYRASGEFEMMMTFFAEDFYKDTPWKSYTKTYVPISNKSKTNKYSRTVINN